MKKVLSLMVFCFSLLTVEAAQIEGAFGLKLGKPWPAEVDKIQKMKPEPFGDIFEFTPKNPLDGWKDYYAIVTPKTAIVACVQIKREFKSDVEAQAEFENMVDVLTKKYVKPTLGMEASFKTAREALFATGDNKISVMQDRLPPYTISISYFSEKASEAANREAKAIMLEKQDTKGL